MREPPEGSLRPEFIGCSASSNTSPATSIQAKFHQVHREDAVFSRYPVPFRMRRVFAVRSRRQHVHPYDSDSWH
ncbi:hypothetical protein PV325_006835 [Microctonus aethiopoides]|nr:hypothetical protein PV325_006835 [Microctonus aethiopoides]